MSQQQGEGSRTKKAGRGKTTGTSVTKKKMKSATGKLPLCIPLDKMVAVGPGAPDFVTKIYVLVKKKAPFNVKGWKKVPNTDTFDIDQTEHNKEIILNTAKRLYGSHKGKLHEHFKKYEINEMALEHKPDEISEEDWEHLVDKFSSPTYKEMSARNKANKSKQVINHRCGRKSFQRDPETQKEPNYQDLWRMTHTNNNGEWVNEASREVHMKVQETSMKMLEQADEEAEKDPIINGAFKSVLGERSFYCHGLGAGIQATKGKSTAALHGQLVSEREKRQGMEMKLVEVETQLQEERSKREEMAAPIEDSQRQLEEREKQFEEKVEKQLEERMEKKLEERMAAFCFRFRSAGQSS
ncbi:uncharacterized protein LOC130736194 [Lotus japonicus]|uniref:uncharacterized protein LOC130736194 n=1 Tax=Lotus japonicus TaxID=34305 RepID=UPI002584128A|nr:uncharacterized protein LOC130736194 [Lotus japonicus]